ncbi:hypothetical protein LXL04_003757 [Taraxacum kok-saghyz]
MSPWFTFPFTLFVEFRPASTLSVDLKHNQGFLCCFFVLLIGYNRGIFGIPSEKKSEIENMVKVLESLNPTPHPTLDLNKLGGCSKLIYSTITILGSRRTKLGLRDFISLGDFLQIIDISKGKAVNEIMFNVRGLNLFSGKLIIEASFKISSQSRVDISYNTSTIIPDQLMNMFRKNYDILLGIFNPHGWLEITYPFLPPFWG